MKRGAGHKRLRRRGAAPTHAVHARRASFEISEQKDCAAQGLASTGFAVIDLPAKRRTRRCGSSGMTSLLRRAAEVACDRDERQATAHRIPRGFGASRPGCSISTTRFIRITSTCGSRWTSASATTSRSFSRSAKDEAFRVQKDYYKRYGTSMRGMMTEHGMKPDDYLEFVHQIDHSPLEPNPALGAAIEQLPGRKLILTNGTRKHADAVMRRLEIHHHFEDVFDIVAAELEPKPLPQTYDRFLEKHGVDPAQGRDVRGSGAQSRGAARARHDHRAGGAGRHARGVARGLGDGRPRRRARRSRHRRSRGVSSAAFRPRP